MTSPVSTGIPTRDDAQVIRKVSRQLEGVFVAQMFAAMRQSAPADGVLPAGPGEEMFRSMLDEKVAERLPETMHGSGSLAETLERALTARLAGPRKDHP